MIQIQSLGDPRISDYIKLKKMDDEVILDGKKVIDNYLIKNSKLISLFVSDTFYNKEKVYCESLGCEKIRGLEILFSLTIFCCWT